jgi:hypothetical protein
VYTVDIPIDTDGDGIQDQDDAFPDPAVAFELFTPVNMVRVLLLLRIYGLYGDYDFNDVALNYQIVKLNSLNLAVQMDIICRVG